MVVFERVKITPHPEAKNASGCGHEQLGILNTLTTNKEVDAKVVTCGCGNLQTIYTMGSMCEVCGTRAETFSNTYESMVYITAVSPKTDKKKEVTKFIIPSIAASIAVLISGKVGKEVDTDLLSAFAGARIPMSKVGKRLVDEVRGDFSDFKPGFNWMMANLDVILGKFLMRITSAKSREKLELIISKVRDGSAFTDMYICPPGLINIREEQSSRFITASTTEAVRDAAMMDEYGPEDREKRRLNIQKLFTKYTIDEHIGSHTGKGSITRASMYSTSLEFSARETLIPISKPHNVDEVHVSYKLAFTLYKHILYKYLLDKGNTPTEIFNRVDTAIGVYDHELYEHMVWCMKNNNTDGIPQNMVVMENGFPIMLSRNPTQSQGSILYCRITEIFRDPNDRAMAYGFNGVATMNADADGDNLNLEALLDSWMADGFSTLAFHNNIFTTHTPGRLHGGVAGLIGCSTQMHGWLNKDR